MTSFTVNGTTVSFTALETAFNDKGGPLEEITIEILVANATDWGALFSLRSWNVTQRPVPGGNNVIVDIGGGLVLDALSAQVSYGWDQVAGSARIVCASTHGSPGDSVVVVMGAGNNVQRFSGTLREFDTTLAPHAVVLVAKGPLYALEEYK